MKLYQSVFDGMFSWVLVKMTAAKLTKYTFESAWKRKRAVLVQLDTIMRQK